MRHPREGPREIECSFLTVTKWLHSKTHDHTSKQSCRKNYELILINPLRIKKSVASHSYSQRKLLCQHVMYVLKKKKGMQAYLYFSFPLRICYSIAKKILKDKKH